jgi:phenylalanyl-tRNA synthetase beta chain
MKFTLDWLFDHLKTNLSYLDIAEKLTELGIEVESVIDNSQKFENFVVGYIKKAEKHPNADKLQVCQVDIGTEILAIVCGAKNAREGIFVAVAKVGALIPTFNEKLKKGNIRGIESQGMMCSTEELLIEDDGIDGIFELDSNSAPGTFLAEALKLNDIIFDVSLTPNRADCFNVRGIARDLAALGVGELLPLNIKRANRTFKNPTDIEIKTDKCPYFSLTAVRNVYGKTPEYIEKRLKAIGQKLISLPVDIANYICVDVGQPFHIFDLDKVPSKLIVRESKQGELIKTLNGKEVILPEGAIVVSSENEPLSIAGIMGGEKSAFSENAQNILIEAAYFDKVSITKTGQNLRLDSDSRTRFERGIDPNAIDENAEYTLSILSKACNCEISEIKNSGKIPNNKNKITLTFDKFNALTGLPANDFEKSKNILEALGIIIKSFDEKSVTVETPSYRHDLEIEEDLIEEILRITGFEKIKEEELKITTPITQIYTSDKISDALTFNGFYEVKTFSFLDKKTALLFLEEEKLITIKDALTVDFSILRPTVISSHIKAIKNSQNKSQRNSKIFEIGRKFCKNQSNIMEENMLTLTMSENKADRTWRHAQENVSIFDVREILEKIFNMLALDARLTTEAPKYYHPGRSGTYMIQKDTVIAHFGEIHPSILSSIDVIGPVVCFEFFLDRIPEIINSKIKKPLALSQYQPTSRDFSFIVEKQIEANSILNTIKKLRIDCVKKVSIFDVYESSSIGEGKKAIAFEVIMQSDKSTLTEDQINEASNKIISAISKEHSGIIRDQ